jgi:asparagine synthase (glutamine-hydrolysing)
MCGILACLGEGPQASGDQMRLAVTERMRRIRHRGPDWTGVYCQNKNVVAHQRLAIVDTTHGSQPLISENKQVVLAVNGEIYNHTQLREQIQSKHRFMTKSDCEIIMHLYQKYDTDFSKWLNMLNGMFSIVLIDEAKGTFVIARDHMGIIPLYMGRDVAGNVWVSSELKGLHDLCVTFEDFLPGHVYSSETGLMTKWYNPKWHSLEYMPTAKVDLKEFRANFEAAVVRQLMSDVPYGVLLSGGLDSSVVSAIAAKHVNDANAKLQGILALNGVRNARCLQSFSIGLNGSPDLAAARIVAKHIGTEHHEFEFTIDEGIDAISDVIYHLETYDVTTVRASTPMYLMSRKIKAMGVKMVLSGEGSDEMFGGYLYFHKCPSKEEQQKEMVNKLKGLYKFDNLRANKTTSAWGVEARVPFLDKEFLDYAMTNIDPAEKMCGRSAPKQDIIDPKTNQKIGEKPKIEKYILRKAFEDLLPHEIVWRQKEQFSDGVGYNWIDSLKAYADKRISDSDFQAAKYRFPYNTPLSKEAYLIRMIFEKHYPQKSAIESVPGGPSVACSTSAAIAWDQAFKNFVDCSGRSVAGVHDKAYDEQQRQKDGVKLTEESLKQKQTKDAHEFVAMSPTVVKSD